MKRGLLCALAVFAAACSVDPGQDRAGAEAAGIRIDSVRFLPFGSRFVLADSATDVAFLGYHAGYVCSRFLELGLADAPTGAVPAYRPVTRIRLPGGGECPVDSGGRDTVAAHVFAAGALIRLADVSGRVTDSALLVRGRIAYDSIVGVPDSAGKSFAAGKIAYRDGGPGLPGELSADSVPACRYLNSADREPGSGDTLKIRYTWVTLDPSASPDSCRGPARPVAAPVRDHRELRMRSAAD